LAVRIKNERLPRWMMLSQGCLHFLMEKCLSDMAVLLTVLRHILAASLQHPHRTVLLQVPLTLTKANVRLGSIVQSRILTGKMAHCSAQKHPCTTMTSCKFPNRHQGLQSAVAPGERALQ